MLETIEQSNTWLNGYVWGAPMIVLLMGTGVLLTILTGAVQFRYLGFALKEVLGKLTQRGTGDGSVSPFQAVSTALASTVGVGNIAGVATALTLGGPGALFWLWISGVLGMCTKFAEIVIALHYREPDATGTMRGGAMYTLRKGLGLPWLGTIFALLTSLAAFGIGNMVQANSVADSLRSSFGVPPMITGLVLAAVTAAVILGGIQRIGQVTQVLVPLMSVLYLAGGLLIILLHIADIPAAVGLVLEGAFTGTAATGGFAGSTVALALRFGIARGLFSNEAGLGSAPMVHSAAQTDHPARQGLYGIFEVFVDTVLVCTVTGAGHPGHRFLAERHDRRRAVGRGVPSGAAGHRRHHRYEQHRRCIFSAAPGIVSTGRILPVCSLLAPGGPGASTVSVPRRTFTTGC